jgi:hypothetical protein
VFDALRGDYPLTLPFLASFSRTPVLLVGRPLALSSLASSSRIVILLHSCTLVTRVVLSQRSLATLSRNALSQRSLATLSRNVIFSQCRSLAWSSCTPVSRAVFSHLLVRQGNLQSICSQFAVNVQSIELISKIAIVLRVRGHGSQREALAGMRCDRMHLGSHGRMANWS